MKLTLGRQRAGQLGVWLQAAAGARLLVLVRVNEGDTAGARAGGEQNLVTQSSQLFTQYVL